ncbi:unnamed protein product [Danaus chrysippus]|uniref:(African queen) hypothetical protein n=1 Tax=Danaus chrysippus TaxID=151541 RepID=A0A8J2QT84_9NEOP|nr:unnamed protein product [Danaus chrysippus]
MRKRTRFARTVAMTTGGAGGARPHLSRRTVFAIVVEAVSNRPKSFSDVTLALRASCVLTVNAVQCFQLGWCFCSDRECVNAITSP